MMPNALQAHNRPFSYRQPYLERTHDSCDPNNQTRIGDRNYPSVVLYNNPILNYFTYYRNPDQETIETESVGSSSIGFDLNKPEEYRIPGMLFQVFYKAIRYGCCFKVSEFPYCGFFVLV